MGARFHGLGLAAAVMTRTPVKPLVISQLEPAWVMFTGWTGVAVGALPDWRVQV